MEFRETRLANGLEIVAECNPQAYTTALGFFVKTGSRDEAEDVAGVSHFLEHMVFKGTPSRTADDVNREFDEMGAYYNAFTSEELTVYYAAVLPEFQDRTVQLLTDIMRPSLRKEDFDTEKKVIIEEIRMYDDQPPYCADEICKALHYGGHPLGRNVLGSVESITDLSVEAMRDYFEHRYNPANICLVGSGNVDFERLVEQVAAQCGSWASVPTSRIVEPAAAQGGFQCIHKESSTQEYVIALADAPGATDDRRYAAKVLATILGDDSGSRLYWELVDSGLAEHASLGHYDYQGSGLYMTYLSCEPDEAERNLQRILSVYRAAEASGVTAEELQQAKNKICARVVLGSERPRGRLFNVGANWTSRREYRTVAADLARVEELTLADIQSVLAEFPLTRTTTVCVGPKAQIAPPR